MILQIFVKSLLAVISLRSALMLFLKTSTNNIISVTKPINQMRSSNFSFGSQHPSVRSVLRFVFERNGEPVRKALPRIGLLCREPDITSSKLTRKGMLRSVTKYRKLTNLSMSRTLLYAPASRSLQLKKYNNDISVRAFVTHPYAQRKSNLNQALRVLNARSLPFKYAGFLSNSRPATPAGLSGSSLRKYPALRYKAPAIKRVATENKIAARSLLSALYLTIFFAQPEFLRREAETQALLFKIRGMDWDEAKYHLCKANYKIPSYYFNETTHEWCREAKYGPHNWTMPHWHGHIHPLKNPIDKRRAYKAFGNPTKDEDWWTLCNGRGAKIAERENAKVFGNCADHIRWFEEKMRLRDVQRAEHAKEVARVAAKMAEEAAAWSWSQIATTVAALAVIIFIIIFTILWFEDAVIKELRAFWAKQQWWVRPIRNVFATCVKHSTPLFSKCKVLINRFTVRAKKTFSGCAQHGDFYFNKIKASTIKAAAYIKKRRR